MVYFSSPIRKQCRPIEANLESDCGTSYKKWGQLAASVQKSNFDANLCRYTHMIFLSLLGVESTEHFWFVTMSVFSLYLPLRICFVLLLLHGCILHEFLPQPMLKQYKQSRSTETANSPLKQFHD